MDALVQASAPGEIAQLASGKVHYQWHGNPEGPLLVLVHGLTTPSFVWAELLPYLKQGNHRILTYDLYGRGYSDRPFAQQSPSFFLHQLNELLTHLNITQPFDLLGYSMGGGIVSCFAKEHRKMVSRLILLAPVGFGVDLGTFFKVSNWPVIGDLAMALFGGRRIRKDAVKSGAAEGAPTAMITQQCSETRYSGYLRAVLSSVRQFPMEDLRNTHRALAKMDLPILAIWAADDRTIPISGAAELSMLNEDVKTLVIPDVGHGLAYTKPETVAAAILGFLEGSGQSMLGKES